METNELITIITDYIEFYISILTVNNPSISILQNEISNELVSYFIVGLLISYFIKKGLSRTNESNWHLHADNKDTYLAKASIGSFYILPLFYVIIIIIDKNRTFDRINFIALVNSFLMLAAFSLPIDPIFSRSLVNFRRMLPYVSRLSKVGSRRSINGNPMKIWIQIHAVIVTLKILQLFILQGVLAIMIILYQFYIINIVLLDSYINIVLAYFISILILAILGSKDFGFKQIRRIFN